MKILRICAIVGGVHILAILVILADPGCSSSKAKSPSAADPSGSAQPVVAGASSASLPLPGAAASDSPQASPAPADASSAPPILYAPTRPGTAAATALVSKPVTGVTPVSTYKVARGDSLWSIAHRHHLTVSELAKANHLRSGGALHVGQELMIPSAASGSGPPPESEPAAAGARGTPPASEGTPRAHRDRAAPAGEAAPSAGSATWTVRPGETLGAIAHRFGVRVGAVATANNISDPQRIHPGQVLVIPSPKRMPAGAGHQATSAAAESPPPASASPEAAPAAVPAAPAAPPAAGSGQAAPSSTDTPVIKVDDNPPPATPVN